MPTKATAVVNFKLPSDLLEELDEYIARPAGAQLGTLTRTSVLIYLIRQLLAHPPANGSSAGRFA